MGTLLSFHPLEYASDALGRRVHAMSLRQRKQVKELKLSGCPVTDGDIACVRRLPNLTSLDLRGSLVTNEGLECVGKLRLLSALDISRTEADTAIDYDGFRHLFGLRRLQELRANGQQLCEDSLVGLCEKPNLKVIEACDTPVDDFGLEEIAKIGGLRELHVNGTSISKAGIRHLAMGTNLKHLVARHIPTTREVEEPQANGELIVCEVPNSAMDNDALRQLGEIQSLSVLLLASAGFDDDGVRYLTRLKRLKDLSIDSTEVSDESVALLEESANLVGLSLDNTNVTDAALRKLAHFRSLRRLYLRETEISNDALRILAGGRARLQLRLLALAYTEMDDTACKHLPKFRNLEALDLRACGEVGNDTLYQLSKLKKLKSLDLSDTAVEGWALSALSGLKLEILFLDDLDFDRFGVEHLCGMKSLRKLSLRGNGISALDENRLWSSLPNLRELRVCRDNDDGGPDDDNEDPVEDPTGPGDYSLDNPRAPAPITR